MFSVKAEFSEVFNPKVDLRVTDVLQKAFINVDENGAEAAAVTGNILSFWSNLAEKILIFQIFAGIQVETMSGRISFEEPKNFHADHPFFFALISPTDTIFMGRYIGKWGEWPKNNL